MIIIIKLKNKSHIFIIFFKIFCWNKKIIKYSWNSFQVILLKLSYWMHLFDILEASRSSDRYWKSQSWILQSSNKMCIKWKPISYFLNHLFILIMCLITKLSLPSLFYPQLSCIQICFNRKNQLNRNPLYTL